jgi:hypothetical protein
MPSEAVGLDYGAFLFCLFHFINGPIVSNQTLMRSASKKGNPSMRVWVILATRWRDRQLAAGGGCAPPPLPHLIPSLVVGERFRVDNTRCTLSVTIYYTFMISSTQF